MSSVDIIVFTFKTVVNTTFQNALKDYKYKKDIGKAYKSALKVKMVTTLSMELALLFI